MSSQLHQHLTLGEFLRAKRAALSPANAGVDDPGRFRRVPGLRREEVAQLAGVSVDYYTRLEQGRMTQASDSVLLGIARALMMTAEERRYLYSIVKGRTVEEPASEQTTISAETQVLLDNMRHTPAIVLGLRMDVLGWNDLGAALFVDFAELEPGNRNLARMIFLEPRIRNLYVHWDVVARSFVAKLRMDATRYPHDPALGELVHELSALDPDFRRWWNSHDVQGVTYGRKQVRHPVGGDLDLQWQALQVVSRPEQTIVVHTAPPGSATWHGFELMAKWWEENKGAVSYGRS
ncbi:helix-turn-helix transcriptional regulator [Saccharothrix sp. Mg75]|uniref:helix-turn-helix transcriptional regulator n=1 Tax=Saccharothrix sp. Mg75 TaxID=3445357 RepID=UPI003EEFF381